MELISRQAAIDAVCYNCSEKNICGGTCDDTDRLRELPSAVKHGRWETEVRTIHGHKIPFFACSVCGKNADDEYRYCPNCGAKMERSEDA